jgi:hypothetical protein
MFQQKQKQSTKPQEVVKENKKWGRHFASAAYASDILKNEFFALCVKKINLCAKKEFARDMFFSFLHKTQNYQFTRNFGMCT